MGLRRWLASLLQPVRPGFSPDQPNVGLPTKRDPASVMRYATDTPAHYQITAPPVRKTCGRGFSHVGTGVSTRLGWSGGSEDRLAELGLPSLPSALALSQKLGLRPTRLKWLAFHAEEVRSCHYVHFEVPKRSGGTRLISTPRPHTAACQRWILRNILTVLPTHDAAHGFVAGRSIVTGASEHVGSEWVIHFDLKDFFPAITFARVRGLFESFGYQPAIASILALLCTESPREKSVRNSDVIWTAIGPRRLPQGACTSPAISNLVCRSLDRRLAGLSRALGRTSDPWRYTRYADDLTFSGNGKALEQIGYLMHRVRGIAREEGFQINEAKTRVQRKSQQQRVTGLVVNDRLAVPRKTVRRLRAILHRARTEGIAAQNRDDHPDFEAWLCGMIGHVASVDSKRGNELLSQLAEVRRLSIEQGKSQGNSPS